jgi:hypothetical protein
VGSGSDDVLEHYGDAEHGYTVRHRDIVPKHVEQLRDGAAACGLNVETAVGDARAVDLPGGGADAVLLLGCSGSARTCRRPRAGPISGRDGNPS